MSTEKDKLINHEDGLNIISALQMIKSSYGQYFQKPYLIDSTIPYEEGVTANILDHLIGFDSDRMLIYGDVTASEQKKNTCYITLKSMNDRWLDGSGEKFEIEWNYGNPIVIMFDKSSFTQADILYIMNNANGADVALSDYRSKLVGKIVTLNNSQDARTYLPKQYVIADINHQDKYSDSSSYTPNSIDLIATNSVIANRKFSSTSPYGKWSTSSIRTWLNGDFKNGFDSEVQALMSQMLVESYLPGTTAQSGGITVTANNNTTDYVKLLSDTELNCSTFDNYMSRREGTPYSDIFTSSAYNSSNTSRVRGSNTSSSGNYWWTRSMYCNYTDVVWRVYTDGDCYDGNDGASYSYGVVPALRLKAV